MYNINFEYLCQAVCVYFHTIMNPHLTPHHETNTWEQLIFLNPICWEKKAVRDKKLIIGMSP